MQQGGAELLQMVMWELKQYELRLEPSLHGTLQCFSSTHHQVCECTRLLILELHMPELAMLGNLFSERLA